MKILDHLKDCPQYHDEVLDMYLISIEGDPSVGMYGDDGEGVDSRGYTRGYTRYCTKEKAIATTKAVAEIFQVSNPSQNMSYEWKTVYRNKDGRIYIMGPVSNKKKIYLDQFGAQNG